jgi:N-acetylmuramoyl-L-alanine amidase
MTRTASVARITLFITIAACASGGPPAGLAPSPYPVTGPAPALPGIPPIDGPLHLTVVHPPDSSSVAVRDSNFIFGSTGSGGAQLSINGVSVPVAPDGAYLAYLAVPPDGVYHLIASKGSETATLDRKIGVPPDPRAEVRVSSIIAASMFPRGPIALPRGEILEVGFTGAAGGIASLVLPDGSRVPLIETPLVDSGTAAAADFRRSTTGGSAASGVSDYRGSVAVAARWSAYDSSIARPGLARSDSAAALPAMPAAFELVMGIDTTRVLLDVNLAILEPGRRRVAIVKPPADAPSDWTARGRPGLAGPYHWFFPPATRLAVDGERNGLLRVRLTRDLSAWISANDVMLQPPSAVPPVSTVSGVRLNGRADAVDVRIALQRPLPFRIDAREKTLDIVVYGATSEVNFLQYGPADPLIRSAAWSQPADGEFRVSLQLSQPVWGYDARFDAAGSLVVRVRRPPHIDPDRPLRGLFIAVDAGHPPGGATGPTGLTEAEANLGVARELASLLEAAGARVLMTRTDASPVELGSRSRVAAEMGVDILVSVHNNAFPDGVNPFENNGSSVYYYQPQSLGLAMAVDDELHRELRLRDLGVGRADLSLVRPTWMPAILSETMFLMMPQQESALRDATVRRRIAQAHVRALVTFLRARAAGSDPTTPPGNDEASR